MMIQLTAPSPAQAGPSQRRYRDLLAGVVASFPQKRERSLVHISDQTLVRRPLRQPSLVTVHDLIHFHSDLCRTARERLRAKLWQWRLKSLRTAVALVTPSDATALDLVKFLEIPRERITVIPNPTPPTFLQPVNGQELRRELLQQLRAKLLLLHVGTTAFYKNLELLGPLLAELKGLQPALIRIGPPLPPRLRAEWQGAALLPQLLEITEGLPDTALARYYAASDLLLMPSSFEGFGWPALEAMAVGGLVVSSGRGGLEETAEAAWVCPELTPRAWAAAIKRIAGSPTSRQRLISRGKALSRRLSLAAFTAAYHQLYTQLLTKLSLSYADPPLNNFARR